MLIGKPDASTLSWGAGPLSLLVAHQDQAQTGGPQFFLPLMGSPGLSTLGCDLQRRDAPIVVKIKRWIGRPANSERRPLASCVPMGRPRGA
jgi:hypothetical protein